MKPQMYKQRRARNEFWFRWVRIITIGNPIGMVALMYLIATVAGCK